MIANHSLPPLVLLDPPAPRFATPTASASTVCRRLPWEMRRNWMSAMSEGNEATPSITALKQTHSDTATHTNV